MRNAIVTAADSNYLPAACCALLSCIGDGEIEAETKLFVLAFDVSAGAAKTAEAFLRSRGASAEIIVLSADHFGKFRVDGYVSASTYSRLLLPEFFDDRWDRLLYIDADMRVMTPLQPLLEADLRGRPVGAVHDYLQYLIYGIEDRQRRLGLRSDGYFNAGLICFDWRATIASGLLRQARAFAIANPHLCKSHDQDALNKAFEGAWTPLDPRWNFMIVAVPEEVFRLDYPSRFSPYVAHFAGSIKPWMANFPARYESHRAWYRDLLLDSPWPHFAAQLNAPVVEEPALPLANRLAGRLTAQLRRFRTTLKSLSPARTAAAPPNRYARTPSPAGVWKDGEANPELARLFEQMVGEAASAGTEIVL